MNPLKEKIFEEFFKNRDELILKYSEGHITKKEFLKKNFNYMKKVDLKPFFDIDSYEKGIFNYQYYNSIAKYYKMMATSVRGDYKKRKYYVEMTNLYYQKKDVSLLKLLEYLEFKNVEAYYIDVNSRLLQDKLYEIVLKDYEFAIFHSKSKWLQVELRKADIFKTQKRESLINEYINEKY